LLHLVAMWRGQGGGAGHPPPLVLTVDHGLRPAAAEEARFVADAARRLGFAHETLVWTGAKPSSGIQDAARRARYDLLLERVAADQRPRDLILAHHLEDQAETFIMRLARGSGIDGLSAMRPLERRVVVLLGAPVREAIIRLRRPLLEVPKARLVATLEAAHAGWREDPSNADVRFERVRLRRSQAWLADLGLTPQSLARSARRLAAERAVLVARTRAIAAVSVKDHDGAYGEFRLPGDLALLPADAVRVLTRLIAVFGGAAPPAQLSQIETLAERLMSPSASACGRLTLGGCIIDICGERGSGRTLTAFREMSRATLPATLLRPGEGLFWDRRFYISVAGEAHAAVEIMPFPARTTVALSVAAPRDSIAALPAMGSDASPTLLIGYNGADATCVWPMQHAAALRWLDDDDAVSETI